MRQAIEEGFILDVLANYTTYKMCYKIAKNIPDKVDENSTLTEDILFTSPSSAASYIGGASLSGNASWRNAEGITLKNIDAK